MGQRKTLKIEADLHRLLVQKQESLHRLLMENRDYGAINREFNAIQELRKILGI